MVYDLSIARIKVEMDNHINVEMYNYNNYAYSFVFYEKHVFGRLIIYIKNFVIYAPEWPRLMQPLKPKCMTITAMWIPLFSARNTCPAANSIS